MKHKVSIITPTYNSERFISETIEAIQAQTYKNWELLITDDCSTDTTLKVVKKYAEEDSRIRFFKLPTNQGGGVARNNSIKEAIGRFIAFCDSDDVWVEDKLEKQVAFIQKNKLAFTYAAYQKMDENGNKEGIFFPPPKITFIDLLKTCSIGCLTAMYDTEKIGKVYMPLIRKRQDYGLWLEIHKKIKFSEGIVEEPLAYYRVRANSVSSNKLKAAKYHFRVLRECGGVSFFKASYYFVYYFVNGLIKYLK